MAKDGIGIDITELTLGPPGSSLSGGLKKNKKKRSVYEIEGGQKGNGLKDTKSPHNNQVVGWPPLHSYRRKKSSNGEELIKIYVKVSMDGAPFLRKIDLSAQRGYSDLMIHLQNLFGSYGIGKVLNEADSSEYVPIYKDKDGDWMLMGDVPWRMFIESCKRLRIMKRNKVKGTGLYV